MNANIFWLNGNPHHIHFYVWHILHVSELVLYYVHDFFQMSNIQYVHMFNKCSANNCLCVNCIYFIDGIVSDIFFVTDHKLKDKIKYTLFFLWMPAPDNNWWGLYRGAFCLIKISLFFLLWRNLHCFSSKNKAEIQHQIIGQKNK